MGTGRKLLLADDSITIQKVVNLTFADEGLEVTTVSNGDLAVEKIEDMSPDIVLADVHMPGLNGYEVCEFVKRNERFRHIPVMLLVGSFEPFNEAEARRVGADDYLTKPFQSIRQLVSKVGSLLSGKPAAEDDAPTKDLAMPAESHSEAEDARETSPPPLAPTAPLSGQMPEAEMFDERRDAFANPILDDAMIEATPAGDFNLNRTVGSMQRPTAPLSAADLEEAGINLNQPPSGQHFNPPSTINLQDTLRMPMPEEQREDIPQAQLAPTTRLANAAAADDALLDLGEDVEPPRAAAEADDFILDIWDDAPAQEASASATVAEAAAPVVDYEGEVTEVAGQAQAAEFVEAEVIEAEPIVEAAPVEELAVQEETFAPPQVEPQAEMVSAEPVSEAASAPPPQAGQITLDQLSPEVIDAIARRAVEQLSEKVIEQIAWEVVPQLAELLIKRRLEEEQSSK